MSQFILRVRKSISLSLVSLFLSMNLLTSLSWSETALKPEIETVTLPTGHQVYVQEIHTQPIVTIDTWINTGSAQENAQNNGVSHFLEHLLFKGTHRFKVGEIDKTLESRGADFNAATSNDFTHYHITTASPYFKEALDMHADMLLNATINPEELTRERSVVQEEINRALDNPGRKAYMTLSSSLFGSHPYAMDTLGPKTNIQTIPREAILDYYHQWYHPENFKTVIAGDVDSEEAVALVQQAFDKALAAQKRPEPGEPKEFPIQAPTAPQSKILTDPNVSVVDIQLGFLAPPVSEREENYALDVAAMILGQGSSSRLNQRLKEEQQVVNSIGAGNSTRQQAGIFMVSAEAKPENREKAKKAILDELTRFKQEGPTEAELAKAKTQVIKDFAFLNESTEGVAQSIGYNVAIATLEDYTEYVSNLQKVTAKDVHEAVNKYLSFDQAAIVEMLPASMNAPVAQQEQANVALLQTAAKANHQSLQAKVPGSEAVSKEHQVTEVKLANGATLLMKPSPSTQTVAFSIFAKGGKLSEPKPGVAALTARVLMKGTENRTAKELASDLERLGLSLGASSDEDYMQITGASVNDDLNKLLLILEDVMTSPTFPQDEIEKERDEMLLAIKTNRDQPSGLMFENLTRSLYRSHPYGAVGERLEASLPTITRDDLVNYYRRNIRPGNLVIAMTGNFDPQWVKTNINQIVSELPKAPEAKQTTYPSVSPLPKSEEVVASKPEQAATWIGYAWLAPAISTSKDYVALKVINTLLGQGLSSRLFVELREKQGLAYHVSSMYPSSLKQGNFVMYTGTDPKNQDKVLAGFDTEIERLRKEPLSAEELERVKSKLIGLFALGHESNANQAFYLGLYETLGVGHEFDRDYPELIQSITAEDIQRVANTVFSKPKVVSIVAPKTVRTESSTHAN